MDGREGPMWFEPAGDMESGPGALGEFFESQWQGRLGNLEAEQSLGGILAAGHGLIHEGMDAFGVPGLAGRGFFEPNTEALEHEGNAGQILTDLSVHIQALMMAAIGQVEQLSLQPLAL